MGQELGRSNALQWKRYLEGLRYPVVKGDILVKARRLNAPEELMELIEGSPERSYEKLEDIIKVFDTIDSQGP